MEDNNQHLHYDADKADQLTVDKLSRVEEEV